MKKLIRSLLIIFSLCFSIFAQTSAKIEPYNLGESLTYEGKYNKIVLRGVPVADLSFTIENAPNSRNYLIKSEARSKGSLTKLAGFKFYQNIQSTVDAENLQILNTVKHDDQGERVRDSVADFDYRARKVTYFETDPNDPARPPRRVATPIVAGMQDLISAVYTIRRSPLAVGKSFELLVSDSGLVYRIPVRVTARERQNSVLGKVWCFRVEPEVFGEHRLIEKEGTVIFWITDDAQRLPVRAQINSDIGRIEVKLKEIKFVKQNPPSKT